jgi:cholinesterase
VWSKIPANDWALKLAKNLGYSGKANEKDILEFLEKPDGMAIVSAAKKVLSFEEEIGLHILYAFGPTIEPYVSNNCFIPKDPVLMARNAWSKDVELMIGATSNEGILRANSDSENISRLLQNEKYFAPVVELGIDVNSKKAHEYGKRIMQAYYKGSKPSASNQQPYLSVRLNLLQLSFSYLISYKVYFRSILLAWHRTSFAITLESKRFRQKLSLSL